MKRSGADRGEGNAGFIRETHGIFDMILERITEETEQFFPMARQATLPSASVTV
jgi:hypothetical protein